MFENLTDSLQGAFKNITGRGTLTEKNITDLIFLIDSGAFINLGHQDFKLLLQNKDNSSTLHKHAENITATVHSASEVVGDSKGTEAPSKSKATSSSTFEFPDSKTSNGKQSEPEGHESTDEIEPAKYARNTASQNMDVETADMQTTPTKAQESVIDIHQGTRKNEQDNAEPNIPMDSAESEQPDATAFTAMDPDNISRK